MTPWTIAHQTSLSMGFSRQEYWSGLPFPFPLQEKEMLLRLEVAISFFFFNQILFLRKVLDLQKNGEDNTEFPHTLYSVPAYG